MGQIIIETPLSFDKLYHFDSGEIGDEVIEYLSKLADEGICFEVSDEADGLPRQEAE